MTRKGEHPVAPAIRRMMARLHALHLATSPDRVAAYLGFSEEYHRRQYRNLSYVDMKAIFERAKRLVDDWPE